MRELALHILDSAENSTRAGASLVEIDVIMNHEDDSLFIGVRDDGRGFDDDVKLDDPFFTSKEGKKFGLGIPFFRQAAEACEGSLSIESESGRGTRVEVRCKLSHIDLMPLGDLGATLSTLVAGSPQTDFILSYINDGYEYIMDTRELRAELDGLPLNVPQVLEYIKQSVNEGTRRSYGR